MALGGSMPEGQRIQKMFSGIAGSYDVMNHLLSLGMDFHWWRKMAWHSGAGPGKLMLDVAAGTGDSSIALAKRGAQVLSSDFTFAMLEKGPRKFQKKGLMGCIPLSIGADAQALPFRDESFDGLTICYGIRNVECRSKALAEFLRVLKPGGRLTVLEFSQPSNTCLRRLYNLYSLSVLPALGGLIAGDGQAYHYLRESIRAWPDQATFASEIEDAGFQQVSWKNLTGGIAALHSGLKAVQGERLPNIKRI